MTDARSSDDSTAQASESSTAQSTGTPAGQATGTSTDPAPGQSTGQASEPSSEAPSTKPAARPATERGGPVTSQEPKRRSAGAAVKAGTDAVRARIASLIWLVAVICALFLAVGALLVALKANQDNSIVQIVLKGAEKLDGPFSRTNGIFTFNGHDAATKAALVNWGIAAVIYLVIGRILDRVIRP